MTGPEEPAVRGFWVLEGIDGCGSSTQAQLLADWLREQGHEVVVTCEPSSGPVGRLIRSALQYRLRGDGAEPLQLSWVTLALLFAADRADHVQRCIRPAIEAKKLVLSDRYDLSSLAYQSLSASEGSEVLPWLREINRFRVRPELTIVIDVPPELAEQRRALRGAPEELFEASETQRRLAEIYAKAEDLVPGDRLTHVSGVGTQEQVLARIVEAVRTYPRPKPRP